MNVASAPDAVNLIWSAHGITSTSSDAYSIAGTLAMLRKWEASSICRLTAEMISGLSYPSSSAPPPQVKSINSRPSASNMWAPRPRANTKARSSGRR